MAQVIVQLKKFSCLTGERKEDAGFCLFYPFMVFHTVGNITFHCYTKNLINVLLVSCIHVHLCARMQDIKQKNELKKTIECASGEAPIILLLVNTSVFGSKQKDPLGSKR